jgi:hypothetical protein
MELKTAIEILEYHQEWRLGKRDNMIHDPKKLTEALDMVLSVVKHDNLNPKEVINSDLGHTDDSFSHDIYLFKVKDYATILLGRYHNGKFYIQRGDGVKYEYEAHRVVWKRLLNCS